MRNMASSDRIKLMYIPLITHSTYFLQQNLALPAKLVQAAQANGLPAIDPTGYRLLTVELCGSSKSAGSHHPRAPTHEVVKCYSSWRGMNVINL